MSERMYTCMGRVYNCIPKIVGIQAISIEKSDAFKIFRHSISGVFRLNRLAIIVDRLNIPFAFFAIVAIIVQVNWDPVLNAVCIDQIGSTLARGVMPKYSEPIFFAFPYSSNLFDICGGLPCQ